MSTRNPTGCVASRTEIGDTVRDAQNTLAQLGRLDLGQRYLAARVFLDSIRNSTLRRQARYPKSLGELCLEMAQSAFRTRIAGRWIFDRDARIREMHALRRAMWHREA